MSATVFLSWQNDSGREQVRVVRRGLRQAAKALRDKEELDRPRVLVDEATRDMPGSPNISESIRDKVRKSDVFVADVTLINPAGEEQGERATPNPNVLFELGFAVAELGWDRIVMIFNRDLPMEATDLPFDIRGQRASAFEVENPGSLSGLLTEAIGLVLLKQPPRPKNDAELSDDEVRRDRDVRALRAALSCIDMSVVDEMLDRAPNIIVASCFHHYFTLDGVVSASTFRLYDKQAYSLLMAVRDQWSGLLSFGVHYTDLTSGDYNGSVGLSRGAVKPGVDGVLDAAVVGFVWTNAPWSCRRVFRICLINDQGVSPLEVTGLSCD